REVAILGGGVTGLASAYYLSRADPKARITLYEASDQLGGWVQTKHVPVEGGSIVFESGPRTLRPSGNGLVTARLLQDLNLVKDMLCIPKFAPAARNRYIYYPDRLNRLPAQGEGLISFFSNILSNRALYSGLISGFFHDFRNPTQNASTADESIGHYISRRFNSAVADKLVSALFHGIYAGDIYKLSVRSLLPILPYLEDRFGSVTMGAGVLVGAKTRIMEKSLWDITSDAEMKSISRDVINVLSQSSVFTLRSGLGSLVTRLEEVLRSEGHATINMSSAVTKLEVPREEGEQSSRSGTSSRKIQISSNADDSPKSYDTVISTLPHNSFASLLPWAASDSSQVPPMPNVSVMVVNLWFRNSSLLDSVPGFGYLIPRAVPYHQNPECALGVIFDTFATAGQDQSLDEQTPVQEVKPNGTKLTVILGGHWWSGWEALPSTSEGINMARTVLARHMGITEAPDEVQATLQRDCIPQYTVGHADRMRDFHYKLLREYGGNLRVAGASYGGVGVNDCVRSA
ncbi:Protoporphyrinogen oxidase, partial [Rhizodiscina lignyota]